MAPGHERSMSIVRPATDPPARLRFGPARHVGHSRARGHPIRRPGIEGILPSVEGGTDLLGAQVSIQPAGPIDDVHTEAGA